MRLFQSAHSILMFVLMLSISPVTHADREQSIKALISWAENNYSELFAPSAAPVQKLVPWSYTYYPETKSYIGVNESNEVWVLGDAFGGFLYIDTLSSLLDSIEYIETAIDASLVQLAYIKASNTNSDDKLGYSVAISGNTLVAGAIGEASKHSGINANQFDNSLENAGAVYVFTRNTDGLWQQQAYIKPSVLYGQDYFGIDVAISNNTLVVGAQGNDHNSIYIYERDAQDNWHQQQHIKNPYVLNSAFGSAVAIDGDTIAVGAFIAPNIMPDLNGEVSFTDASLRISGAVFVYKRVGVAGVSTWINQAFITPTTTDTGDRFGTSIALAGNTLVVGSPLEDGAEKNVNGSELGDSGAAYVFERNEAGIWKQQAYLKASNADSRDEFGTSVAVSGNTVAVGAILEDSKATGINNDPLNNSETDSGAAYIFTRDDAGIWTQQAYIKASNTDSRYKFANAIELDNNTLVVGSQFEGKSGTGINSIPENGTDRAPVSGAAYLYTRTGTTWSQGAYIKASNTGLGDSFGFSLGLSDKFLAIGAMAEFSFATGINGDQSDNSAPASGAIYVFE